MDSAIPPVLPISPISLECPHCWAKPGHDCKADSGEFTIIHLARISVAAKATRAAING